MIFNYYFAYQISRIFAEEMRQRCENLKGVDSDTNNPHSHPKGFNVNGNKRKAKNPTPDSPNVKTQRIEDDHSIPIGMRSTYEPSTSEASVTLWSDIDFNAIQFKRSHLPFFQRISR